MQVTDDQSKYKAGACFGGAENFMSWKNKKGSCNRCNKYSEKLYPSFGKYICSECKDSRPRKGKGNAGLFSGCSQNFINFEKGLALVRVAKSDQLFGKLFFEHYPNSKGIPGRSLCYLIYNDNILLGIIGVNSPPKNYKIFTKYFNSVDEIHYVNNNVFRLIVNEKNIGTQVLKVFRRKIKIDYELKYGDELVGIVTFVEPPRNGAVYKADNWDYLGETQGKRMTRREDWEKTFTNGTVKLIYAYKYKKNKGSF